MNYWQKGFLIGFLLSVIAIVHFVKAPFYDGRIQLVEIAIAAPLCYIEMFTIHCDGCAPPLCIFTIPLSPFIYGTIGAFIGNGLEKLRKKKENP